ncbi:isoaspartyl peptidase/L-asparaginase [Paraliomyxa miuraensis]|uniref:isoaspartyl peptidase/L-asparaginase n=1 Tax=Paraliomyxa miuraensis TaxID=376150 RepID=UPI00225193AE|nr:isoaspartyl peptidase/L-asparaginase [Paraliomyxa miuraensis]MCX4244440.1 isoaspartyl peptidase/L-asparaginase [Paraliomyxa miuraensis]
MSAPLGGIVPTIVVHGGAGRVAPEHHAEVVTGVRAAAERGRAVLVDGGDCEAAVIAAVRELEDREVFNAGRGACMTADGRFEVDAGIMRSHDRRSGAVAAVADLADPILVARAVMNGSRHCLLAGEGAAAFARRQGVGTFGREHLWTPKAQARYDEAIAGHAPIVGQADTVGAVAIDARGHLCVGCSTGGVLLKSAGRVGDSPLVGSGFHAAAELGAACATGLGEAIMAHVASYTALLRAAEGIDPDEAADEVCARVASTSVAGATATCGIILITSTGAVGVAHRSPHMSWAVAQGTETVVADLQRTLAPSTARRL